MEKTYLNSKEDIPVSLRNNNPGNIKLTNDKWMGQVPREQTTNNVFAQFKSVLWGIRAMMTIIANYIVRLNIVDIKGLVKTYDKTNNTGYYNFLVSMGHKELPKTKEEFVKLVYDMITFENGYKVRNFIDTNDIVNGYARVRWDLMNEYFKKVNKL